MRWLILLAFLPTFAQNPGIIEGTVADRTGAQLPNADVDIGETEAGPPIQSVRADTQGRFRFPALKPGSYYVRFRVPGFSIRRNGPIAIVNGARFDTGTIQLNLSRAVAGCCYCKNARPLFVTKTASGTSFAGYVNAARMDLNGEAVLKPSAGPPLKIRIEEDGTFEFLNLVPGRYSLRITVPTYVPFEIPRVDISPGTAVEVDGWIVLSDCPPGQTCAASRTVQREGKPKRNAICL